MAAEHIDHQREIDRILAQSRRIAVLGIKPESHAAQPAYMIPAYMQRHGFGIVPVPVYYPDVTQILGEAVFRRVADIGGRIDIVDVFRKPTDLMPHLEDLLAARPRVVWLQTGITHEGFANALVAAGIDVVQDKCLMVEHRRWVDAR